MADEHDELEAAQRELDEAAEAAAALAAEEVQHGVELERVGGGALNAEAMRAEMETLRRRTERAQQQVERAAGRVKAEMDRRMRQQKADLEQRMGRLNEAMAPVKKRLALMQEGIETLSLYLSAASGVVQVLDGERAPELEPIVIRQMVLRMDEESGLFADGGGINADKVEEFDAWLRADWANVVQLLPEAKCVVACVATLRERERNNPWSKDPRDQVTHFLVRNGRAVYRTTVNDFMAGEVLLPRADEFVKFFRPRSARYDDAGRITNPLKPGTSEYAKAMDASDKRGRHFLRIGLILQGLVDNSEVFAPLHPAGVNMLTDPSERSEKVRIVTDAEGALESGAETFNDWQRRVNAELRPGMRVIGYFGGWDSPWKDANEWDRHSSRRGHSRVRPTGWNAPTPPTGVPMLIEERDGQWLIARFSHEMDDTQTFERRTARRRASVKLRADDAFILPFDLIPSSEFVAQFLRSRKNRADYRELWPLLRTTMHAKAEEERVEAPFKTMLAGVLARENGVTVEEAAADVDDLVRWFKFKNRWDRPLTLENVHALALGDKGRAGHEVQVARGDQQGHEARAVRLIVAEHARRVADRRRPIDQDVVATIRRRYDHGELLAVVRPRRGGYMALLVADLQELAYVHEHDYTTKGEPREVREWRLIGTDRPTRWTFAYRHDQLWDRWHLNASAQQYLAGPEMAQLITRLTHVTDEDRAKGREPLAVTYRRPTATRQARLVTWWMTGDGQVNEDHLLTDEPKHPTYIAQERGWKRVQGGGLEIVRARQSWYDRDDHEWRVGKDGDKGPWTGSYAKDYAERFVWGPSAPAMSRWTREVLRVSKALARRRELANQRDTLERSIAAQWYANRVHQLYAEWLQAHVDDPDWTWAEWEKFQYDEGSSRSGIEGERRHHWFTWSAWPNDDGHALRFVLRWLVEQLHGDLDLTGKTVAEVFQEAIERGLPMRFVPNLHQARERDLAITPETAGLVFGAEPQSLPEDPAAMEEEPDEHDEDEVELAEGVHVVGPEEPEPDRDMFDNLRDAIGDL